MTIIAWDGRVLAADKMSSSGGFIRKVTKIYVVPEGIVGFCGSGVAARAMLEWFRNGRKADLWPKIQGSDKDAYSLFVDWSGRHWTYEDWPHPIPQENSWDAIGSGRDYAAAMLHTGQGAVRAVQVASDLCIDCGMGYDVIVLEDAKRALAA